MDFNQFVYIKLYVVQLVNSGFPHCCRVPVKTVYQGLGKGTVAVAFSSDAKYMASVSAGPEQVCSTHTHTEGMEMIAGGSGGACYNRREGYVYFTCPTPTSSTSNASPLPCFHLVFVQCIAIWDWTIEGESPSVCASLDPHLDKQVNIHTNRTAAHLRSAQHCL